MKNLLLLIFIGTFNFSCNGQVDKQKNIIYSGEIDSIALKLESEDVYKFKLGSDSMYLKNSFMNNSDFNPPIYSNDTILVLCDLYLESLDTVYISSKEIKSYKIKVKLKVSFDQYFTDQDRGGSELDLPTVNFPEQELAIENQYFIIPRVDRTIYKNGLTLKDYIEKYQWELFFNESYKVQKEYFENLLKTDDDSWPLEYKQQAREFLKKIKSDFKTLDELSIQIPVKSIIIDFYIKDQHIKTLKSIYKYDYEQD